MSSGLGAELNGEHYLLAQEMVPIDKPERLKTRAVHQQDGITDKSPEPFENYMAKGVRWKVKD